VFGEVLGKSLVSGFLDSQCMYLGVWRQGKVRRWHGAMRILSCLQDTFKYTFRNHLTK